MAKTFKLIEKRVLPMLLAVALIATSMFTIPLFASAEEDPWAATGLHKTTVIDFNGSTNIADYTAQGTTPVTSPATSIKDGALLLKNVMLGSDYNIRFDAYGDIETLSMDIKTEEYAEARNLPGIVFYDEIYTDKEGNSVAATSTMGFSVNAQGYWRARAVGLCGDGQVRDYVATNIWDWSSAYYTVTLTYGTEYLDNSDNGTNIRYDNLGNQLICKFLTNVAVTDVNGDTVFNWDITTAQADYNSSHTTYGVNRALTDVDDNENVMIGFGPQFVNSYLGMYVDNIKVTYRNVAKVEALIDAIGTVEVNEACLANIVKAETAFGLLSDEEKAEVSNAAALTAARETYNTLLENADIAEVEALITAIGTVDASDASLAKIIAAEEAYMALAVEKQVKVSNYAVLKKARADYNAAKYGIHSDTVIDFNGSTNIADYTAQGTTPTIANGTAITDGALHVAGNNNIRFDAYGDIETLSMDIKMDSETKGAVTPGIVFYDEIYTYLDENGEEQTVAATSTLEFGCNANGWRVKSRGNAAAWRDITTGNNIGVNWAENWLTVTFTYGETCVEMKNSSYDRLDRNGKTLYCKYVTKVELTNAQGIVYTWKIDESTHFINCNSTTYGVNWTLTGENVADNENVTIGFTDSSTTQVGMSVDNIKVTYRGNVAKVEALIDAIGTVEATDTCLAKIVEAETVYGLLSADEKEKVSNYETLTTARATYNNLVENADVYAVEALIAAIGVVENSEACLGKIVVAEEAFAALSPEKQALVSNAATLTAAREAYNELVIMAPVKAVEDLITAIGTVEASGACLEKIVAAEEAYAALSEEKQALVSNYAVLEKARADYNAVKYGINNNTVIDFNGSTNIADYTAAGTTPALNAYSSIKDGALYLANPNNNIRFDAYGDIETLSMDIKTDEYSGAGHLPGIVFYDEIYTDKEGNSVAATSTMAFSVNASGQWRGRIKGLSNLTDAYKVETNVWDWSSDYYTLTLTYGTTYIDNSDNGSNIRYDNLGNELACKFLTNIVLTDKDSTKVFEWKIDTTSADNTSSRASYGVNRTLTDAADNENVMFGFGNQFEPAYLGMYVDNIKVTYRNDKATGLVASAKDITTVDNSAALVEKIALMEETYNVLPANQQDSEAKAAIDALKAKIAIAATAEAPTVEGATIRTTTITSDQNLRFRTTMPTTAIDGYEIVEFGTVMFPAQYLGDKELTLDSSYKLSNGNIATVLTAKGNAADYEEIPAEFDAELYGIDFSESKNACGIRISARSYVKYSDGETTFIIYSKNDKKPNTEATEGVKNGTCTRSVFSVARTMAAALLDTTTYPTDTFGEIVGSIDLATNTNTEILEFVYNNLARLRAIAAVQ